MNPLSQEGSRTPPKTSGLAIGSLICGILCVPIVSIVLGHLALSQIKRSAGAFVGKGMAIVGLILGYVTVLIPIAIFVIGILSAIAIGPMGDIFQLPQRTPPDLAWSQRTTHCRRKTTITNLNGLVRKRLAPLKISLPGLLKRPPWTMHTSGFCPMIRQSRHLRTKD